MLSINRLILLVLLAALSACGSAPKKEAIPEVPVEEEIKVDPLAQEKFDEALAHLEDGKLEEAEVLLNELKEEYPELSGSYSNLALIAVQRDKLEEAVELLQQALEVNAECIACLNHLAAVLRMQGKFTESEQAYIRAAQLQPDYRITHLNLGILYDLYLLKPHKALQCYRYYQNSLSEEDEKVALWVVDLERRISRMENTDNEATANPDMENKDGTSSGDEVNVCLESEPKAAAPADTDATGDAGNTVDQDSQQQPSSTEQAPAD